MKGCNRRVLACRARRKQMEKVDRRHGVFARNVTWQSFCWMFTTKTKQGQLTVRLQQIEKKTVSVKVLRNAQRISV